MPTINGILIENKVVTVANNDTDINNEITAQSDLGWLVVSLTISGTDVIILFTKQSTVAP